MKTKYTPDKLVYGNPQCTKTFDLFPIFDCLNGNHL